MRKLTLLYLVALMNILPVYSIRTGFSIFDQEDQNFKKAVSWLHISTKKTLQSQEKLHLFWYEMTHVVM